MKVSEKVNHVKDPMTMTEEGVKQLDLNVHFLLVVFHDRRLPDKDFKVHPNERPQLVEQKGTSKVKEVPNLKGKLIVLRVID